ncbi:MAG: tetratricopeptide repeat protein [Gammaproteobacteria bacterium]|nr:tetratricopeptide repeat protein [Gammaproteobacteria bacterium]MDH3413032.1 tetratricopeptide repeat protein [Gammaproteobacteria bacterium]
MKHVWIAIAGLSALIIGLLLWSGIFDKEFAEKSLGVIVVSEAEVKAPNLKTRSQSDYVGGKICATCHAGQAELWSGSHHDLAMQHANDDSVLGNFSGTTFTHFDVSSTFSRDGESFMVRTDGPDGELHDYRIKYTFGVTPLQQYLVEFPDGRVQALSVAWDSRPEGEGGQRWFHLYPEEPIARTDPLHWTQASQNWNYMCAECHSTKLRKNYDAASNRFNTTWAEINVSCEACHGPGAAHVEWAESDRAADPAYKNNGLIIAFNERLDVAWQIDPQVGNAVRSKPNSDRKEIEVCARCHSRRSILSEDYVHGRSLMDTHRPALLSEGLYYPDGQIQDEVYVYGSFLQSKMYHAGVTCSDCHEPHSLNLRAPGDQVCMSCHSAERFASPAHHFHQAGSPGAQCVECHMPDKNYMVIDPRRDHSIRIPRPDLSERLGTPNACSGCHVDQSNAWASEQLVAWYGKPSNGFQDFDDALHAGQLGAPEAPGLLIKLIAREDQPGIARATAVSLLGRYPIPQALQVIKDSLHDDDSLVRLGGLEAVAALSQDVQLQLSKHLLDDPVLAVRIEAGRLLASVPANALAADQRTRLNAAVDQYIASQQLNADRPQAQINLGNLYARIGQPQEAEVAYRQAMMLDPRFAPAYLNLADLYRQTGREAEAQIVLRQGLEAQPDDANLSYALGLALVRGKNMAAATEALARAAELAPDNSRYPYVYAIALDAAGNTSEALEALEQAHDRHPYDQAILEALVNFALKSGKADLAGTYRAKIDDLRRRAMSALGEDESS